MVQLMEAFKQYYTAEECGSSLLNTTRARNDLLQINALEIHL